MSIVALSESPILAFLNNAGQINAGGSLLTQVGGVNYPTYQDPAGLTPLPNPIPLNSRGEISNSSGVSCQLFLVSGVTYVFTLFDAAGNQLWTASDVMALAPVAVGSFTDEKGSNGQPGFSAANADFVPGTTTSLTLSQNYGSASNLFVAFDAAEQGANTFSLSGTTLTFNAPIPIGTQFVFVKGGASLAIGTPGNGTVTDATVAAGANINSSKLAFLQGSAGAATRTVQSKLQDCISAYDFGCKGDGTTDDTVAMQAAFTAANTLKKELFIPSGTYRLTAQIVIDNSAQTTFPQGRLSVRGEGPQNTVLQWDNGSTGGLSIKGSITGIAANSQQSFKDFSLIKSDGQATGGYFQSHSHLQLENMWVLGWNEGFDYEDIQESIQTNVVVEYCVIGLHASRVNFTLPNVLSFYNCTYGNNKQGGLDLIDPTTVNFDGGSIESNNDLAGGPYTPIWGCRITLQSATVNEGTCAGTFKGVYFERNGSATVGKGLGDVYLQNSVRDWGMTFVGCQFNRGATFSTNQIGISSSGGWRGKLVRVGCTHDAPAAGGYPGPSTTRPYVGIFGTDPIESIDEGNYHQAAFETPNYTGSIAMPNGVSCAQARLGGSVRFNGTSGAIVSSFAVGSVTRTGVGTYTVAFTNNQANSGSRVYQSMLSDIGFVRLVSETASAAVFLTTNPSGTATDFANVMISWAADPAA